MQQHLVLAFTGTDADVKKAYLKELQVSIEDFRQAYDWLVLHNEHMGQLR